MAKPRKLKSGRWNIQIFTHRDENRKRHYKSITADTKKECLTMAARYQYVEQRKIRKDVSVYEAIDMYIESRKEVLSASTVKAYKSMLRTGFGKIEKIRIRAIDSAVVQDWIAALSRKLSPKSVANHHGLLVSAISYIDPSIQLKTQLPQRKVYNAYVPTNAEVESLINYFEDSDDIDMANAVRLAAYGTLRRSEICGLRQGDIDRVKNVIHVHSAEIMTEDEKLLHKDVPKTSASDRYIQMPEEIIAGLPEKGKPVDITPNVLSLRFRKAVKLTQQEHIRFHDLRHYAASVMHVIGIPDAYIMKRGGWETDSTLKKIYRGTMSDYEEKYTEILLDEIRGSKKSEQSLNEK